MTGPLNPLLYHCLQTTFKHVGIVNDGMRAQVSHRPDWTYREGRLRAEVSDWGEVYKVNCPFCNDIRQRLCISHLWARTDEQTRDDMLHLVKCHNDDCVSNRERQKELHALV